MSGNIAKVDGFQGFGFQRREHDRQRRWSGELRDHGRSAHLEWPQPREREQLRLRRGGRSDEHRPAARPPTGKWWPDRNPCAGFRKPGNRLRRECRVPVHGPAGCGPADRHDLRSRRVRGAAAGRPAALHRRRSAPTGSTTTATARSTPPIPAAWPGRRTTTRATRASRTSSSAESGRSASCGRTSAARGWCSAASSRTSVAGQPVELFVRYLGRRGRARRLATVTPGADGQFQARVKKPPPRLFNRARYRAQVGSARSVELKLPQSLASTLAEAGGRRHARAARPGRPRGAREAQRRSSSSGSSAASTRRSARRGPNRRGVYVVRFPAPTDRPGLSALPGRDQGPGPARQQALRQAVRARDRH